MAGANGQSASSGVNKYDKWIDVGTAQNKADDKMKLVMISSMRMLVMLLVMLARCMRTATCGGRQDLRGKVVDADHVVDGE